jgi:predicted transcriptional regulator
MRIENDCKKIKRIDLDVLERLMLVLYENTEEKKTNIARDSKMSYDKCVSYLDVLEMMEFVKKNNDEKNTFYGLTPAGIIYSNKIIDLNCQKQNGTLVSTA